MKPPLLEKLPGTSWAPEGLQIETEPPEIVLPEKVNETRLPSVASKSISATFSLPANSTVFEVPREKRPVVPTLEVEVPLGGMKRSGPALDPSPVPTDTGPPSVPVGTLNLIVLEEAAVTSGRAWLRRRLLAAMLGPKFEPETVTSSPLTAREGEIDEMLGARDSRTVKLPELMTGPSSGVDIETGPEVAPLGTLTVSELAVAALTLADVPLNLTTLELGVVENPVPSILTVAPTCARAGLSWRSESFEEAWRLIESRFPPASQL
jgi:hypothetical protein